MPISDLQALSAHYPDGPAVIGTLRRHLAIDQIAGVNEIGFIMFGPDALATAAIQQICKALRVTPLLAAIVQPHPAQIEQLYARELLKGLISAWWIKGRIFNCGPSVPMLVRGTVKSGDTLCGKLLRLKGNSDPLITGTGTIRGRYRVSSKAFGFMHSADDPFGAVRESMIFWPPDVVAKTLAQRPPARMRSARCVVKIADALFQHKTQLSFSWLIRDLKIYLCDRVRSNPDLADNKLRDCLTRIAKLNRPRRGETRATRPALTEWSTLRLLSLKEVPLLRAIRWSLSGGHRLSQGFGNQCQQSGDIAGALRLLCQLSDVDRFNRVDGDSLVSQIVRLGFPLNDLQKLLLIASFYFYNCPMMPLRRGGDKLSGHV
jgi:nucleoside diphosphate kinase